MQKFVSLLLGLGAAFAAMAASAGEDERLGQSRALVGEFGTELMGALQGAMAAGGPAAAIEVCRTRAPEIAARLSRRSGANISRISARFRNPQAVPEDWQRQALDQLRESMPESPAGPASLPETFALDGRGGARYLKAIAIGPLCLSCHGETLSDSVASQLGEDYPHDRATGYRLGELRGAFSVVWPAP